MPNKRQGKAPGGHLECRRFFMGLSFKTREGMMSQKLNKGGRVQFSKNDIHFSLGHMLYYHIVLYLYCDKEKDIQ